jgi:PPOX class probable F420-dependent enzyme
MGELDGAKYISLTTFKRDGTRVSAPVWITGSAGSYAFITGDRTGKVKRLRNNPSVEITVSDMRGRTAPGATVHAGTGELVSDAQELSAVRRALVQKYGFMVGLVTVVEKVRALLGHSDGDRVAIRLTVGAT